MIKCYYFEHLPASFCTTAFLKLQHTSRSPGVKHRSLLLNHRSQGSDSVDFPQSPRICFANRFPGDALLVAQEPHFESSCYTRCFINVIVFTPRHHLLRSTELPRASSQWHQGSRSWKHLPKSTLPVSGRCETVTQQWLSLCSSSPAWCWILILSRYTTVHYLLQERSTFPSH